MSEKPEVVNWVWLEPAQGEKRRKVHVLRLADLPGFVLVAGVDTPQDLLLVHRNRLRQAGDK